MTVLGDFLVFFGALGIPAAIAVGLWLAVKHFHAYDDEGNKLH
ncbi:hypothetical protein [Corynebacterium sp. HS2168-gen11]|nr:hypothetical protein [Corynebacterium sp. HS2168-gen11]MCS4534793.1 hypothetical protein [Corynebacterium sp. HS2168-gen11]